MIRLRSIAFGIFAFAVTASIVCAQEAPKKRLPQEGVLSSTARGGYGDKNVGGLWGDSFGQGGSAAAPIQGSVSRVSPRSWSARVANTGKEPVSLTAQVLQIAANGSTVKTDSLSTTLKPGEMFSREFSASVTSVDATLKLTSWKSLAKKKEEPAKK